MHRLKTFLTIVVQLLILAVVPASRRTHAVPLVPLPQVLHVSAVRAPLAPDKQSLDDPVADGAEVGEAPAPVAVPRAARLAQRPQADGAVRKDDG